MRSRSLLRFMLLATGFMAAAPGCGKQKEGEPCDVRNLDDDCDGALQCIPAEDLLDDATDRCCQPKTATPKVRSCTRRKGSASSAEGSAGAPGAAGSASESGRVCAYHSDCESPLVCGPQGRCQEECYEDRDCPMTLVCQDNACVLETQAPSGTAGAAGQAGSAGVAGARPAQAGSAGHAGSE